MSGSSNRMLKHGGRRTSFTLIEVLLALVLTTLVVTITGRIAVQTVITEKSTTRIIRRLERTAALSDRLADDFAQRLEPLPGVEHAVMVFGSPRQVLQLNTLAEVRSQGGDLHLIRRPATVRYRLTGTAHQRLIRETIDRTLPRAKPIPETVSRGVSAFKVQVLSAGKWLTRYPAARTRSAKTHSVRCEAVRVSVRFADQETPFERTYVLKDGA